MDFLKTVGKALLITIGFFMTIFLVAIPFALISSGYVIAGLIILFLYVFFAILGFLICKP